MSAERRHLRAVRDDERPDPLRPFEHPVLVVTADEARVLRQVRAAAQLVVDIGSEIGAASRASGEPPDPAGQGRFIEAYEKLVAALHAARLQESRA